MCGIAGFIDFKNNSTTDNLANMVKSLNHRGPDDKGYNLFQVSDSTVGLGQARLSIIDLSSGGHQPMKCEHLWVVFNGEIYNYKEIRTELMELGHIFISNSDTEVILRSHLQWGSLAVNKFIGMFAYVLLDKKSNTIFCYRDRTGIKPFYYYWHNNLFLFASELKAFNIHPGFEKSIDSSALGLYFDFGYVPAPYCIFENAHKLEPGHYLEFDLRKKEFIITKYWDVKEFYSRPNLKISYKEAKSEITKIIKSACEYRMVADVPVGVFLSGGYDSALVTSILQQSKKEKLKTFTIGFEAWKNEAPFAQKIAEYLGAEHTEYYCTVKEAQSIIPELPYFYDEPFADSSAIPTTLVSRIARKDVTVALSADGGDEVFAGYDDYKVFLNHVKVTKKIPKGSKKIVKVGAKLLSNLLPENKEVLQHKLRGFAKSISFSDRDKEKKLYYLMTALPEKYFNRLFTEKIRKVSTHYDDDFTGFKDSISVAQAIDYMMYLQNDILTKVDRASMSISLEAREPLLDHRIIEYAATLPSSFKFDGTTSKKILKDIVHDYIPREMMDRPKSGFSLPIYKWLNGDLSYLIDEFLNESTLKKSKLLNPDFVNNIVTRFKSNSFHYKPLIWKLLQFQMWYCRWC